MSTTMEMVMEMAPAKTHGYSYEAALAASRKVNWRVEDIIGGDKQLDFAKPFMPESLARVESLDFLSRDEKRTLNQIRGNSYLCIFGVVEEFILPFLMDHARPLLSGDDYRIRALLQFAGEEAKHIHLFKRFREEFENGFGVQCSVIGPPEAIAAEILAHDPMGVALTILGVEWMTQSHYLDSMKDDQQLDPQFKSLLKHHWMEEAQHAKLDVLMVEALADGRSRKEIMQAVEEYLEIGAFIDDGLKSQTQFDLEAFERATGRTLTTSESEKFVAVQLQANRWTYLGSGMTHPNFLATLQNLLPEARERIEQVAPLFC
ncbi:MAG TPA: diiron oxygenase [Pyrinomonadaceae bacterium]